MTEVADDTIVDGRYRVLGRIGSGGMADVYRAEDTHLGREVALKVLHRRFAQDAEFVERFRREAKSAAGLQHPHVVGVFDRGEYEGTYYIAMECLSGRTLKELVNETAPMNPLHVIDLGIQILQAAAFAHRRGVIHRDFKPHNVIVDDEGVAKVTDFGIARAGASEMTETGSIMGTAQYLSPEQAQGHAVTAASDLYSIGVMLYEMVTGRLPFTGDSAVSIALKHLQEPPPPMSSDGMVVEPNLETVVLGALAKDPLARWQSGEDFAAALEACRPYVEAHDGTTVVAAVPESTAVFDALPAGAAGPTVPVREPVPVEREYERRTARRRRWPAAILALMVLALIGLMAYAFTRPEKVDVPKVEGLNLTEARERLDKAGFEEVKIERERSQADLDTVLRQDPDPGEEAANTETVTLAVSSGPGKVRVPSVRNLPEQRAFKELEKADLKVTADPQPSTKVKKGIAVGTSPEEGTEVDRGSRVRLFVSSGPQKVTVPNVIGLARESAESRLDREGLTVVVQMQQSSKPEDEVIAQSPGAGTKLDAGDRVTITISEGVDKVTVPDVQGLTEREALRALQGAGLNGSVRDRETDVEEEDGTVLVQRPGSGAELDSGSTVTLVVGRLVEPEATTTDPPATPNPPTGQ
jgi:serine/threonine-protein kinase